MCAVGRRAAELVVSGKDAQEAPQRSFSTSSRDMPSVSNYIKGDFRLSFMDPECYARAALSGDFDLCDAAHLRPGPVLEALPASGLKAS